MIVKNIIVKSSIFFLLLLLLFPSPLATPAIYGAVNEVGIEITTFGLEQSPKQGTFEKEMLVTAYYKPLRSQRGFATGSYRREVRLNGSGITSTGKPVRIGHAAADPKVFPAGSVLKVPGHGWVVVEDTGSRIKGDRLDIFVGVGDAGQKKALEWGKKNIKITIFRLGKTAS